MTRYSQLVASYLHTRFYCLRLILAFIAGLLSITAVAQPSATGLSMTGGMKEGFTLTINYTYIAAPNPQGATSFQWFTYDNNCGLNKTPIAGATSSTLTLTAAQVGLHISCEVTPRDNVGTVGTVVEYRPWDCTVTANNPSRGPNRVLANGTSCSRAGGIGTPNPYNDLITPAALCSPRTVEWTVKYTGIDYSVSPQRVPVITIDWDDGSQDFLAATLDNPQETNLSDQRWSITRTHTYDYDAGISGPSDGSCSFIIKADFAVDAPVVAVPASLLCDNIQRQIQTVTVWDTEDNALISTLDINHDPTSAGTEDGNPAETTEICAGDTSPIRVLDSSKQNCTPGTPGNETDASRQNSQGRWVQWVYGTSTSLTGPVTINGTTYNPSDFPVYGVVEYYPDPNLIPVSPQMVTKNITMPATGTAGQFMQITLRKWNTCNKYDDNDIPNPLDPVAGTFNVGPGSGTKLFPASSYIAANNNPVIKTYNILIVAAPATPDVADQVVCFGDNANLAVNSPVGGVTYKWYNTLANATSMTADVATGTTYNVTPGAVGNNYFYVRGYNANGCPSPIETVTVLQQSELTIPGNITGPGGSNPAKHICKNTTVSYQESAATGTATYGGAWTYEWAVDAGGGGSTAAITAGQNTRDITIQANAIVGTFTLKVRKVFTAPNSNGSVCPGPWKTMVIEIEDNPVSSPPAALSICVGNIANVIMANPSGYYGPASSLTHTWTGATSVLATTNTANSPVRTSTTAGTYTVTYVVTDSIGCSSAPKNTLIQVYNPPPASNAGPDQNLCIPAASALQTTLAATDPAPAGGQWRFVSVPSGSLATNTNAFSNRNIPNPVFTVDIPGTYHLEYKTWTGGTTVCTSNDFVLITFGRDPSPITLPADYTTCGVNTTVTGTDPGFGTKSWSQVAGAGTSTFGTPTASSTSITVSTFGVYTFRYEVASGGCPTRSDDITITFTTAPIASAPADFNYCISNPIVGTIALNGTVAAPAIRGYWERVTGSGTFTSSGAAIGSTINGTTINDVYTPSAGDFALGSITFRLVGETGIVSSCSSASDEVTVFLDQRPAVNAGTDISICGASTTLNATATLYGGTAMWTSVDPTITFVDSSMVNTATSGFSYGTTPLTYTAKSAGGVCADVSDVVNVIRNTPPDAIAVTVDVCESTAGSNTGSISLAQVQAAAVRDQITGIAGSVGRTVSYFTDAARLSAFTGTMAVTSSTIIYTRVTRTDVTPGCTNDGVITFNIDPLPPAITGAIDVCEDIQGTNTATALNLVLLEGQVTNNTPGVTVSWFTDAARTIPVATPTNQTVTGSRIYYTRVVNNATGCENTATITINVNPRPSTAPIVGETNVCTDPNALHIYQITALPGSTFQWSIPSDFVTHLGGTSADFFALLKFPNPVDPGKAISVAERSAKGCLGTVQTLTVTATPPPPAITISGPSTVCENSNNVVFTATAAAGVTYTWLVPVGTTIMSGQGTNTIQVNFTTFGGTIYVTPSNSGGCSGSTVSHNVAITIAPVVDPFVTTTVCSEEPVGLMFTTLGATGVSNFNITGVVMESGLTAIVGPTTGTGVPATAVINDQFVNITSGPLGVDYTVEAVGTSGCRSASAILRAVVLPEPIMNSALNKSVCSNVATGLNLSTAIGSTPATTYDLLAVRIAGGLTADGANQAVANGIISTSLAGDIFTNNTASDLTVEYDVVPVSSSGCKGDMLTIVVTINPEPLGTNTVVGATCSDEPYSINPAAFISNSIASDFIWTAVYDAGLTGGVFSGTGTIVETIYNSSASTLNVVYTITPRSQAKGCDGATFTITKPIFPTPLGVNSTEAAVCSGTSFTIDVDSKITNGVPATFTWVASYPAGTSGGAASGTGDITETLTNSNAALANVVYTITPLTANGCSRPSFTITVPIIPNGGTANVTQVAQCSPAAITYTNGFTYIWTATYDAGLTGGAGTGVSDLSEVLSNNTGTTLNVVYTITNSVSGCSATPYLVTIPIKSIPLGSNATLAAVCSNNTLTIDPQTFITNGMVSTFTWSAVYPAGVTGGSSAGVGKIIQTLTNTTSTAQNVVYTITPTSGGCSGAPFDVTVPIEPAPIGASSTLAGICSGSTINIDPQSHITNAVTGTFTWFASYSPGISGGAGSGIGTIVENLINSGGATTNIVYTITPTSAAGCTGAVFQITIPVIPGSGTSNITATPVCSGDLFTTTLAATSDWLAVYPAGISGGAGSAVSVNAINETLINSTGTDQVVTYVITPNVATGCGSGTYDINVTIHPTPVGANTVLPAVCTGSLITIDPSVYNTNAVPSTYSWTAAYDAGLTGGAPSGFGYISQVLVNGTTTPLTATFTITPTSTQGCVGTPYTVTIVINPMPVAVNTIETAICAGDAINIDPQIYVANGIASNFGWTAVYSPGVSGSATSGTGNIAETLSNASGLTGNAIYNVSVVSAGGCNGNNFSVVVPVNPAPIGTNTSSPVVCSGSAFSENLQTKITNGVLSTFTWTATYNAGLTGGASNGSGVNLSETLVNTTSATLTAVYTITPTSLSGCVGADFTITIQVDPAPTTSDVTLAAICSGNLLAYNPGDILSWSATYGTNLSGGSASGSGAITQIINNTGSTQELAVFTITTLTGSGCIAAPYQLTVPIDPTPIGSNSSEAPVCSNTTLNIDPQANITNGVTSTFNWTAVYPAGISGGAGAGSGVISETLVNSTAANQTVTYTVTPSGACTGNPFQIQVTIIPSSGTSNITSTPICSGDIFNATLASSSDWTAVYPAGITGGTGSGSSVSSISESLSNVSGSDITVTYTITPTTPSGCGSGIYDITVIVRSEPVGTTSTLPAVCSSDLITINPATHIANGVASSFTWTATYDAGLTGGVASGSGIINQVLVNNSSSVLNAVFTITPTSSNGCAGLPFDVTVSVNPKPLGVTTTAPAVCSGDIINVDPQAAITNGIASTFTWTATYSSNVTGGTGAGSGVINETLLNTSASNGVATYTVTPTSVVGCAGNQFVIMVPVNPSPVGADFTRAAVCSGESFTELLQSKISNGIVSTFTWTAVYDPSLGGGAGAGTGDINEVLVNSSAALASAVYTVTPTSSNGCAGATFTVTIPVKNVETFTDVNEAAICSGAIYSYNPGNIVSWTATYGANLSGGQPSGLGSISQIVNNTGSAQENVIYTIVATASNGCPAATYTVTVPVDPKPVGANSVEPATCSNTTFTIDPQANISNGVTATFTWTAVYPAGISGGAGAGSGVINETLVNSTAANQTVTYTVTPSGACTGNPFQIQITILPSSGTSNVTSAPICSGDIFAATLATNSDWTAVYPAGITGGTGSGSSVSSISESLSNVSGSDITVTYTITPTTPSGCGSGIYDITVIVRSEPVGTTSTLPAVCSNDLITVDPATHITNGVASSFTWTATYDAGLTGGTASGSGIINQVLTNNSTMTLNAVYTFTPTSSNGCAGAAFVVTVPVDPKPLGATTTATAVCSGDIINVDPQAAITNGIASTFTWTATYSSNVTGGTGSGSGVINETLLNTSASNGVATYTVTPTSVDGCAGNPFVIMVPVNPSPVGADFTRAAVCSGESFTELLQSKISNSIVSTFTWTAVYDPSLGGGAGAGTGDINEVLVNSSAALASAVYTVTPISSNGCAGATFTVTIPVKNVETFTDVNEAAICSGAIYSYNPGNIVSWTATYGANLSGGQPSGLGSITQIVNNNGSAQENVIYTIIATASNGCPAATYTVTVPVDPKPVGANSVEPATCSNTTLNIDPQVNITNGVTSTFNWTAVYPAGISGGAGAGSGVISETLVNSAGVSRTVQYTITPSSACAGNPFQIQITILPSSGTSNIISAPICSGDIFNATLASSSDWTAVYPAGITGGTGSGSSVSSISESLSNVSGSDITVTYTITPTTPSGCGSGIYDITVIVRSEPVGTTSTLPAVCSSDLITINPATHIANGVASSFTWTATYDAGLTGGVASGSGIINQVLVNNSSSVLNAVFTITPTSSNGCAGLPFDVTVSVNPKPLGVTTTAPAVCSGDIINVDPQAAITNGIASTFTWTATYSSNVTGGTGSGSGLISETLLNTSFTNGLATYTVTPTSTSGCSGNSFVISVPVNPSPVGADFTRAAVCSGENITEALQSKITNSVISSFTWVAAYDPGLSGGTGSGAGDINETIINASASVANAVYTVTPISSNGCAGATFTVTIPVKNVETFTDVNEAAICSGATYSYNPGNIVSWTATYGANLSGGQPSGLGSITQNVNNTASAQENVIYTIVATASNGCPAATYTVTVPVDPKPVGANSVEPATCSNTSFTIDPQVNISNGVISTFNWTAIYPAGISGGAGAGTGLISETLVNGSGVNKTIQYTVMPIGAAGCAGTPFQILIDIQPGSGVSNINELPICSGDIYSATLATSSNWTAVYPAGLSGGAGSGTNVPSINETLINTTGSVLTVIYTVTPTSGSMCGSGAYDIALPVNPAPSAANTTLSAICSGDLLAITPATYITNGVASSFTWTAIYDAGLMGGIASGNGNINMVLTNGSSTSLNAVYTFTPTSSNGCAGAAFTVTAVVEPKPVATNSLSGSVCSGSGININPQANIANGVTATFTWTASYTSGITGGVGSGSGNIIETLSSTSATSETATYTVIPTSMNGCTGASFVVIVKVNPVPMSMSAIANNVCSGASFNEFLQTKITNGVNSTFTWTAVYDVGITGGNGTGSGNSISEVLTNSTAATLNATYTVTPTSIDGCVGASFDVVVPIVGNPVPANVVLPAICSDNMVLHNQGNIIGWTSVYGSNVSGGSGSGSGAITEILSNISSSPDLATYTVTTLTSNGCIADPYSVSVTINPKPVVTPSTAATVCSNVAFSINPQSNVSNSVVSTFTWTALYGTGISGGQGSGTGLINEKLINSTSAIVNVVYTVTASASGCSSGVFTITVPISPSSAPLDVIQGPVCSGDVISYNSTNPFTWSATYDPLLTGGAGVGNNSINETLFNTSGGVLNVVYTVSETGGSCGANTYTVTVPVRAEAPVTLNMTSSNGNCDPFKVTATYNQTAGVNYTWKFYDGSPDSVYTATATVANQAIVHRIKANTTITSPYTFTVFSKVAGFCENQASRTLSIAPPPIINTKAIADTVICSGSPVAFSNYSIGGTTHTWYYQETATPGARLGTQIQTDLTQPVTFTIPNTSGANPQYYQVVYELSDGACVKQKITNVLVYSNPVVDFTYSPTAPVLMGGSTSEVTVQATATNVAAYSYVWDFGFDASPSGTSGTGAAGAGPHQINYLTGGSHDIALTAVNLAAQADGKTCSITVTKTVNLITPVLNGAITATPKEACVPAIITTTNSYPPEIMEWKLVDASGKVTATSNVQTPVFTVEQSGVYRLLLKVTQVSTGLVKYDSVNNIKVYPAPRAVFEVRPETVIIPQNVLSTFNFTQEDEAGTYIWKWNFGDGSDTVTLKNPEYQYQEEGQYIVTLKAGIQNGAFTCYDTASLPVTVILGGELLIPNAFTPNTKGPNGGIAEDGTYNDVFIPINRGLEKMQLLIFDRWGNLIYESNDPQLGWDGYDRNGLLMPAGVYAYKINYTLIGHQPATKMGDVTLLR